MAPGSKNRIVKPGARKGSHMKVPLVIFGGTMVVAIAVISFASSLEPEPFSRREILAKEKWTEDELVRTVSRYVYSPKVRRENRELVTHLRKQVKKLPNKKRKEVHEKIVVASIKRARQDFAAMPEEKRKQIMDSMLKQMKKRRKEIERMSPKQKEKLKRKFEGEGGTNRGDTMRKAMENLTPDERRDMAPLVKEWVGIIESL